MSNSGSSRNPTQAWTAPRYVSPWTWLLPGGLGQRAPPDEVLSDNFHYNLYLAICLGEPLRAGQPSPPEIFARLHDEQLTHPNDVHRFWSITNRTRAFNVECERDGLDGAYADMLAQSAHLPFNDYREMISTMEGHAIIFNMGDNERTALRTLECQRIAIEAVPQHLSSLTGSNRAGVRQAAIRLYREMCAVVQGPSMANPTGRSVRSDTSVSARSSRHRPTSSLGSASEAVGRNERDLRRHRRTYSESAASSMRVSPDRQHRDSRYRHHGPTLQPSASAFRPVGTQHKQAYPLPRQNGRQVHERRRFQRQQQRSRDDSTSRTIVDLLLCLNTFYNVCSRSRSMRSPNG